MAKTIKRATRKKSRSAQTNSAHAPAQPQPAEVTITAAKGRPMLAWVGKRPLAQVTAFPAQHVETYSAGEQASQATGWPDPAYAGSWPAAYPQGGLLFHGDNKEVLAHLLANGFRGEVKLIYIDPPFDSGADYVRKVQLRGSMGTAKLDGETYALGEQIQYTDIWANDNYLQFMYERLLLLKGLLADDGSIYMHCDPSRNSYLRIVLDEVFGSDSFVNEIVWQRLSAHNDSKRYGIIHDTVYYYSLSNDRIWRPQSTAMNERYVEQFFDQVEASTGRRYSRSDLTARGLRNGETGKPWRGISPGARGNHWKVKIAQLDEWDQGGKIHWPKDKNGMPRLKRYLDEVQATGVSPQDIWYDIRPIHNQSQELGDYPTQKPESLLERIIQTSSDPGDLVLDCFIGSGTTAAVAQKLGRRWIGCDINKGAIQTTAKRLQGIMREQAEALAPAAQPRLVEAPADGEDQAAAPPAQLAFGVWRVNDYDLQIRHNEAANLAAEYLGLERTRTDSFFDGTLHNSKRLVKLVPFNHPLSPLDLEEVKRELDARPDEDRPIALVCLGIELAAQAWIEEWNQMRKGNDAVNRIDVVELRTDPRYGGFLAHKPATARVKVKRRKDTLHIEIVDFISPGILERLAQQAGPLLAPKIDDWRAIDDSTMLELKQFRLRLQPRPSPTA